MVVMFIGEYGFYHEMEIDEKPVLGEIISMFKEEFIPGGFSVKVAAELIPVGDKKLPLFKIEALNEIATDMFLGRILSSGWFAHRQV
jgi:hypothetical protein